MKRDHLMAHGDNVRLETRKQINNFSLIILIVVLIIFFCCCLSLREIRQLKQQIAQLEQRQINNRIIQQYKFDQQLKGIQENLEQMKDDEDKHNVQRNRLHQSLTNLNQTFSKRLERLDKVIEYYLYQENARYHIMLKQSKRSNWKIQGENQSIFKDHYTKLSEHPMKIAKHSQGYSCIDNELLFSSNDRFFVQVKIQKTKDNQIGIGIHTIQPFESYLFWVNDKQIYDGKQWIKSKSEVAIKENDMITMLYDPHSKQIVFYVNKRYVGHTNLPLNYNGNVQPYIPMGDKGDIISIL